MTDKYINWKINLVLGMPKGMLQIADNSLGDDFQSRQSFIYKKGFL
jgi:hypothetical protein